MQLSKAKAWLKRGVLHFILGMLLFNLVYLFFFPSVALAFDSLDRCRLDPVCLRQSSQTIGHGKSLWRNAPMAPFVPRLFNPSNQLKNRVRQGAADSFCEDNPANSGCDSGSPGLQLDPTDTTVRTYRVKYCATNVSSGGIKCHSGTVTVTGSQADLDNAYLGSPNNCSAHVLSRLVIGCSYSWGPQLADPYPIEITCISNCNGYASPGPSGSPTWDDVQANNPEVSLGDWSRGTDLIETDGDWVDFTPTAPPSEPFITTPDPAIETDEEGRPYVEPGPTTVPNPDYDPNSDPDGDPDGDGLPNDSDPDDDGDGIPDENDQDHPNYDPTHPNSDPDLDGIPNDSDPDDNGDGTPDLNDPTHPEYDPVDPGSDPDNDGLNHTKVPKVS